MVTPARRLTRHAVRSATFSIELIPYFEGVPTAAGSAGVPTTLFVESPDGQTTAPSRQFDSSRDGRAILKCSQNHQKTVLPLPVCFAIMDINQKTTVRPLQADDRIERDIP